MYNNPIVHIGILAKKLGISLQFTRVMDDTTILLRPDEFVLLKQKAPYLISMA
jgi:hypothetical protein